MRPIKEMEEELAKLRKDGKMPELVQFYAAMIQQLKDQEILWEIAQDSRDSPFYEIAILPNVNGNIGPLKKGCRLRRNRLSWYTKLINFLLKGTNIMATLADVNQAVSELTAAVSATDLKLDEVLAFIQSLQVGQPVTQAQLDQLFADVTAAKVSAQAVLAEADTLDGTP